MMNVGNGDDKDKNTKRKFHGTLVDSRSQGHPRNIKRILLSLSRPSYTLGLGLEKVRTENRDRLCRILQKLVRHHNWAEAGGVLSVLLQGTCKDRSPALNRLKYWDSMELLKHIEIGKINPTKIKHIYETWMRRIGPMKQWPVEDRFLVQLEFILFCLMEGNLGEAHQAALCLMQEPEFGKDPKGCLIVGLTFYQMWYSTIPKEMQLRDSVESYDLMHLDNSLSRFNYPIEHSVQPDGFSSPNAGPLSHGDSYTSVMNNKECLVSGDLNLPDDVKMEIDMERERPYAASRAQGFYVQTENSEDQATTEFNSSDNLLYNSIFSGQGWDLCLLPLRLPCLTEKFDEFVSLHKAVSNDEYKFAVKYLRLAMCSKSTVIAALLPLIQLLLIVGQVQEALSELDDLCCNSDTVLFFRLRASILENVDRNSIVMHSSNLEDIMRKDPTCCSSLAKLVSMHQNGEYAVESLLEMIGLHLDATRGDCGSWRELALCFFKLFHHEEDRMSTCVNGDGGGVLEGRCFIVKIPAFLTEGKRGKDWRLRCRWWTSRYFSSKALMSEISGGDLEVVSYKAVCASYMYGPDFQYVGQAISRLEEEDGRELLLFFRRYAHDHVGFYP